MSKKVKCKECDKSMRWALPGKVTASNLDYAKYCLDAVKRSMVCGQTMKTKNIEHEQYCKHYCRESDERLEINKKIELCRISDLEKMIEVYQTCDEATDKFIDAFLETDG